MIRLLLPWLLSLGVIVSFTARSAVPLKAIGHGKYMRTDAARWFNKMVADARKEGIELRPRSGFRTSTQQRFLYNLFKSGYGARAARPGRSRHEKGTAVDIALGASSGAYKWLLENGRKYHFVRPLRSEPWHWEYRPRRLPKRPVS